MTSTPPNPTPESLRIELGNVDLCRTWYEPICTLYDAAFSAPPHHWELDESEAHRARLDRLLRSPSFGITVALTGNTLIGFCYGSALLPNTTWWNGFLKPLPAGIADEHEGRTFAVIDLAVEESWRGQGFGRQLLATLLASRSEERATLAVQPQVERNHQFYLHLGWQLLGRAQGMPGEAAPFFDIFMLPLREA